MSASVATTAAAIEDTMRLAAATLTLISVLIGRRRKNRR